MNRHLYRLVFNAARGQIMAVAEVAASHAGGNSAAGTTPGPRHSPSGAGFLARPRAFARTTIASVCTLLMALPAWQMARAQVVADPQAAATLRPQILSTANGTTQVNIQAPSSAGVSRNVYSQFDIDKRGAILNNATAATQTRIGGWVQANGNLSSGSARVILNEVNATAPSQLRGFVEVAGQRAEVVIANPAGIAVNGGGFINASAVTLTTGTPILNSGNLEGYRVTRGTVQIEGNGLDASGADYARILARAVQVNAGLWAQDLKVVTGAHQSNADASVVTPIAPTAGTTPRYALDVAALGGMYAGKITLVGTEAGLGVNNAGVLAADRELVLRTDGQLVNRGVLDAQTTRVEADDLQNLGTGRIYGDHVAIQVRHLNNAPETADGATSAPVIAARNRLDLAAGSLVNGLDALLLSGGDLTIGGTLDANLHASGSAQTLLNAGGTIEALGNLYASAGRLLNTNPGFAYEIRSDGSFAGKEYITASGIYTPDQVAWILAENTFGWAGPGGGYRYSSGQGRLLPAGHAYADKKYQPYYNSANAYVAAHTTYTFDFEGNSYPVEVPDAFAYTASDPVWSVLGVTPPSGPAPGPRPTTSCDEFGCDFPSPAELNAWQAAAAPWITLQSRLNSFRASVNASAITFTSFRNYTQDIPVAVITASTPGQILSGGDITLHASAELLNEQSRIQAGGTLAVTGHSLNNQGLDITAQALRSGRAYAWSNFNHGCGNIKGCDYNYNAYRESNYSVYIPRALNLNSASAQSGTPPGSAGLGATGALPTSSLFHAAPDPQARYLIETDPLFTSYRTWLSSDYMLSALALDPDLTQKRLGDGYYEQRLVREQVAQLTGRRFLDDYTSDEQQYRALLNAGVAYAQAHASDAYALRPGIALSADQIAALTQDMVWLVAQTVTFPDGTITTALVPRLYTVARDGDLDGNGALLSARKLDLELEGQFSSGGRIAALEAARISANDIQLASSGATDLQADRITLQATQDIRFVGSRVEAGSSMNLQAGRDIQLTTTTSSGTSADGQHSLTQIDRVASLAVTDEESTLISEAGRNLNLTGATMDSAGSTRLQAGENIVLDVVQTASSHKLSGGNASHSDSRQTDVGSQLRAGGDLSLQAGNDLRATAAQLQAGALLKAEAGQDILIQSGHSDYSYSHSLEVTSSNLFSSSTTRTEIDSEQKRVVTSSLEGDTVSLHSNRDTTLRGSNVLADKDLNLQAGRDVRIQAAQETSAYRSMTRTHESGLLSGGNLGISIGSREQRLAQGTSSTTAVASTVGSMTGDLNILAAQTYTQIGSNVLTPQGNIEISAQTVSIQEARGRATHQTEQSFQQSGLTLGLGGGIIDTMQTTTQAAQGVLDSGSHRNKVLNFLIAYGKGTDLVEQGKAVGAAERQNGVLGDEGKPGAAAASGIKVSISLGSSGSQSNSSSTSDTAAGSTVKASGNVSIRATGQNPGEGDLTVQGSKVQAGQDLALRAASNVNIVASADTEANRSNNTSSSTSVGVSFGIGAGSAGLSLDVAASRGKGQANSDSVTYTNSHVISGNQVIMTSGLDTNIQGGNVTGQQVTANVGGDLNIASLQDTARSAASQSTTGMALSIPITGAGGSVSLSQAQQRSNSNYASVHEQSGIQAGDGGFSIDVQGNTDLHGAVIASTDKAVQESKNTLVTSTLTTSDISNSMNASASSSGTSVGTNMRSGKYELGKALAGNALNKGRADQSDASTTTAAISAAVVTVGGKTTDTHSEELTDSRNKVITTDTSDTHRTLDKADVARLQQLAQQQQADNMLTFKAATAVADDGLRKMAKPQLRQVFCLAEPCSNDQLANTAKIAGIAQALIKDNPGMTADQATTLAIAKIAGEDGDPSKADPLYAESNPNRDVLPIGHAKEIKNIQTVPITIEDLENLPNDQKTDSMAFANGIFNSEQRAAELAIQQTTKLDPKSPAQHQKIESTGTVLQGNTYLVHTDKSNNLLGELVTASVEKLAEILGVPTPAAEIKAQVIRTLSTNNETGATDNPIISVGHSRGTMTDVNTYNLLARQGFYNPNLKVIANNPAAKQERIEQSASQITHPGNVQIYAPPNDPISTFVGGYETGDTAASIKEISAVFQTSNSVHSSPTSGAVGSKSTNVNQPFSYQGLDVGKLNQTRQSKTNSIIEQVQINPEPVLIPPSTDQITKLQDQMTKNSNRQMDQLLNFSSEPTVLLTPSTDTSDKKLQKLN